MEYTHEDFLEHKRGCKAKFDFWIIGNMLHDYNTIPEVTARLSEKMFSGAAQKAFLIIKEQYSSGAISPNILKQLFEEANLSYDLFMEAINSSDEQALEFYMDRVIDYYISLEGDSLLKSYTFLNHESPKGKETLSELYYYLGELLTNAHMFKKEPTVVEHINSIFDSLTNREDNSNAIYSKEIPSLNTATGGMLPGNFVVLAGFLKSGKSTTALTILMDVVLNSGIPSAYFSLEQTTHEIYAKIISSVCQVPYNSLRNADEVNKAELERNKALAKHKLAGAKLMVDTDSMTLEAIVQKIRYYRHKFGLRFVVVDYIQLIETGGRKFENDERKIAFISRTLKALAKELNIVIFGIGQLNRSANAKPMTTTMAGSLNICKDADALLIIYSPLRVEAAKNDRVVDPEATTTVNFKRKSIKVGIDKFVLYLAESRHTQSGEKALLQMKYGSQMREIVNPDEVL